jgi:hypothetical protein
LEEVVDPSLRSARRIQRILDSLRADLAGEGRIARARRIFERPREVFRLEIENPELGYQRTTLLDREALEELLASGEVRDRVRLSLD